MLYEIEKTKVNNFYKTYDDTNLPLISVIVPVYNAEKTLKDTLRSVLSQKYNNIELICVNDGSTDQSLEILNRIAKFDNRVIVINQSNQGPAKARNSGLDRSHGKYISFVDSDDVLSMDAYKNLVYIAETSNADIVVFGGNAMPNTNVPEWIQRRLESSNAEYVGNDAVQSALFHEPSSRPFLWLHFIKRELIENNHLRMDESLDLGEDQVFQFNYFAKAEKVVFTKGKYYTYYWNNSSSLMGKYNLMPSVKIEKHFAIIEKVLSEWCNANREDPFGDLVSWVVDFVYWDIKRFPKYKQIELSKRVISMLKTYNQDVFMCNKDTIDKANEINAMANSEQDENEILVDSIAQIRQRLEAVESEIQATVNSRAFKLGRLLTKKSKRLSEKDYLPKQEKRN